MVLINYIIKLFKNVFLKLNKFIIKNYAKTDLKLVYLERQSFKRLIGPLEELLKRNFARYTKFVS